MALELGLKLKTMGSTTLDLAALNRSAEPDTAYYIQNQPSFSQVPKVRLYEFLAAARLDEMEADGQLRKWVQENYKKS